jgi:hypothetical protein
MMYYFQPTEEQLNSPIPDEFKKYMDYDENYILKNVLFAFPIIIDNQTYYNALLITEFTTGNTDHELTEEELIIWKNYTNSNLFILIYNEIEEKEIMVKYE